MILLSIVLKAGTLLWFNVGYYKTYLWTVFARTTSNLTKHIFFELMPLLLLPFVLATCFKIDELAADSFLAIAYLKSCNILQVFAGWSWAAECLTWYFSKDCSLCRIEWIYVVKEAPWLGFYENIYYKFFNTNYIETELDKQNYLLPFIHFFFRFVFILAQHHPIYMCSHLVLEIRSIIKRVEGRLDESWQVSR